jgi:hypothetical protein
MVSELKQSSSGRNGIIVLTHKERQLLKSKNKVVVEILDKLHRQNLIGMHWGHYTRSIPKIPFVDFHLASPGTIGKGHNTIQNWISLSSRNFVDPIFFSKDKLPRKWDILYVCRALKLKNIHEMFLIARKLLDLNHSFSILLQINAPLNFKNLRGYYAEIQNDYENMFSVQDRSLVKLNFIVSNDIFPIATEDIAALMRQSRIVALLSNREGESRVISEALASNCWILCKSRLKGGGRDLLSTQNSIQFSDLDECVHKLIANKAFSQPKIEPSIVEAIHSSISTPFLRSQLERLLEKRQLDIGNGWQLTNLDRKLPSHTSSLGNILGISQTDDLKTETDLLKYACSILNENHNTMISEFLKYELILQSRFTHVLRNRFLMAYSKIGAAIGKKLYRY